MMPNVLKISEAASLALHTMAYLAADTAALHATRRIAGDLGVSEAHLAKVLQRLGREGLVKSQRGPGGGFSLARDAATITLLDVYQATEGPLDDPGCLLGRPACGGGCILGGLLEKVTSEVRDYLGKTRLSDLNSSFGERRLYA